MRERLAAMGVPVPAFTPVATRGRRRGLRAPRRLAAGAQGRDRRLRRQGRLGGRATSRRPTEVLRSGVRLLAEEHVPLLRELAAAGRPLARGPGRGLAGRRDGAVATACASRSWPRRRTCRRSAPGGAGPRAAAGRRARRRRRDGGGAVRDGARDARQRAGDASAQLRPLDDRGLAHLAVRAAPARGARLADGRHRAHRAVGGHGQRARRRTGDARPRPAAAHAVRPRPGAQGAPVRQGGAARAARSATSRRWATTSSRPGSGPARAPRTWRTGGGCTERAAWSASSWAATATGR